MTAPQALPPRERYVDARELAQLMGVSVRTIKRMTAAGMPSEDWGLGNVRRYLPSEALAWARTRHNRRSITPPARRTTADRADQKERTLHG